MQKITPFLWFEDGAGEAARFYVSVFRNARIKNINRYSEIMANAPGRPPGPVMLVEFNLDGEDFIALTPPPFGP